MMMACIAFGAASAEEIRLTREDAVRIVLNYTGLKAGEVTLTHAEQDWDDGRQVWEIEFIHNGVKYEFTVDSTSGRIMETDLDRDHDWDDFLDDIFDFD